MTAEQEKARKWLKQTIDADKQQEYSFYTFDGLMQVSHHTDIPKLLAAYAAEAVAAEWLPIATAPRDGTHILVTCLATSGPGSGGFGYFNGKAVPFADVVHYWSVPGEEGFYPSNGPDEPYTFLTHWKPIGAKFPRKDKTL
jgi:hypothetical protein